MIKLIDNIWNHIEEPNAAFCITTNKVTNYKGYAIMGAGIAKQARDLYKGCDEILGELLRGRGHVVQQFWSEPILLSFPTKYHWREKASLELIETSTQQLVEFADATGLERIYLPTPGVENGKLSYEEVFPVLAIYLTDDRFILIDLIERR